METPKSGIPSGADRYGSHVRSVQKYSGLEFIRSEKTGKIANMVEAWIMDDVEGDQRLPHKANDELVSLDVLREIGVLYWKLDPDVNPEKDPVLQSIRAERGYTYQDIITISKDTLPDYDAKIKTFFEEHIHTDEEIRYILDGSGYFDVRSKDNKWIRIHTKKGDMIVLPAGIYHRFTLDEEDYIKAMRLFVGEPVWVAHNRVDPEVPNMEARQLYEKTFLKN